MPYTPPSHRSPSSSAPSSPDVSRRSSFHGTGTGPGVALTGRPVLPRSASYLTKSRRTPPAPTVAPPKSKGHGALSLDITPPGTSEDLKGMVAGHSITNTAIRQSPPPVADARSMPPGAIISPPESQSSSEDEGVPQAEKPKNRGRQIENLKELQDAISTIPQHRESSPNRSSPGDLLVLPSQIGELVEAVQNGLAGEVGIESSIAPTRKVSHMRSSTEPNIFISKSADTSLTASEDSEEDHPLRKPQMVRKKSGELVRPALRPASSRRPSSMPGTPTFSKAVHFDSHLEHVRHFLQVDRPLAVSAGSSPADNYDSDTEYPFGTDGKPSSRTPPFEWEIVVNNFPEDTPMRKALPARVERLWMSPDQKSLLGSIAIANLAFQKSVVCRFTFDYWKTTSEVGAEFLHEIRPRESETGHDRFQFTIKLSDLANLESKTLFFCIRYNVNGQEYWDNNNNMNFQIDFRKKMLPQNGKKNFQGAAGRPLNSLPRSGRRANAAGGPRPRSMLAGNLDDFGHDTKLFNFEQPIHDYLGESGPTTLRLKSSKSTTSLPSDNLANRLSTPSGLAFANRYDFGASLNATMQAHKDAGANAPRGDGLYMKAHKRTSFSPMAPPAQIASPPAAQPSTAPSLPALTVAPNKALSTSPIPGTGSPASSIASASYEEIVNKYCFFNGSKQSSPQLKDGTLRSGQFDGAGQEFFTHASNSTASSSNNSPQMADRAQQGALRYAIHQNLNPYFQNTHINIGASPAESPLNGPAVPRQALSPSNSSTSTAKAASPAPGPGGFSPLAGTSPGGYATNASPFHHVQHHSDRFPFAADAHASPAIRG